MKFQLTSPVSSVLIHLASRTLMRILGLLVVLGMVSLATAQPINDDCENAVEIVEGVNPHNSIGATGGTDLTGLCEVNTFPDQDRIIHDSVFYLFTAPSTGWVRIRIHGAPFHWRIAIYDGDQCPLDPEAVLGCETLSTVEVPIVAGRRYLVEVGGRNTAPQGTGTLAVEFVLPTPPFIRGDVDGDGVFNGLVDGITILEISFLGSFPPPCEVAADFNGDGIYSGLVDGLGLLNAAFIPGSPPPPAPFPECGTVPPEDLGCAVPPSCTPAAPPPPDPRYVLSLTDVATVPGYQAEVRTILDSSRGAEIWGISFGVCASPAVDVPCVGGIPNPCIDDGIIVQGAQLRATNDGAGAGFFAPSTTAAGWKAGIIVDLLLEQGLPPQEDAEIVVTRYRVFGPVGATTELSFCEIGDPPALVCVKPVDGPYVVPETVGGTITVEPGATLIRGDANANGVFNALLDALFLLEGGFIPGSPQPPCADAADADDDGQVNALTDGLAILNVGFVAGTPLLPPPFPECGVAFERLGCDSPTPCP